MQKIMIKTQVLGYLGSDATVNNVNGKSVINFSVAHTESYKNKENVEVNKVTWVRCAKWVDEGRTNLANYLKKGDQIYVEGTPEVGIYTNDKGITAAEFKLRVEEIQLLGKKKD